MKTQIESKQFNASLSMNASMMFFKSVSSNGIRHASSGATPLKYYAEALIDQNDFIKSHDIKKLNSLCFTTALLGERLCSIGKELLDDTCENFDTEIHQAITPVLIELSKTLTDEQRANFITYLTSLNK